MFRKVLLFALLGVTIAAPSSKLEASLTQSLKHKDFVNIFVKFQGGNKPAIEGTEILTFANRGDKINHLVDNLKSLTQKSQGNAVSLLKGRSNDFKQFWVSNELYIKQANGDLINSIAALSEVVEIREEQIIPVQPLIFANNSINAEWNIELVEAPQAWVIPGGNNGNGAVVANIDTGVRRTHEALKNNYRESRGWLDPYDATQEPNDSNGHGTHTMGIIIGFGGIGVAPGAQWIACRGCGSITCTESALVTCGQWVTCPTDANGQSSDCTQAPSVVSNSWGGGQGGSFYDSVIDTWQAANIIPVFAIGNSGPSCGTASYPGDSEKVLAVGATTAEDGISGSSSAGPSLAGALKPDISAPGALIRSAWHTSDNAYSTISGTSMACPHVAGGATILRARNPNLTYTQVKKLLQDNADKNLADTGRVCEGIPSTQYPNHQYGHGRLNVRKSLEAAISA